MPCLSQNPFFTSKVAISMRVIMICVLVFFVAINVARAEPEPTTVREGRLDAHFDWLDDPGEALALQQVIDRWASGEFEPLPGALGRGYTLSHSWLSLRLSDLELNLYDYLWMEPSQLNEVDVFYQVGIDALDAGSYQMLSLGDHTPGDLKPYRHFRLLFPLKNIRAYQGYAAFQALGEYQIFIRVKTTSTHALKARLLTDAVMVKDSNFYLFFYAGFTTIAFILAAFSLFIAYRLRDKIYFWYALYLVTIMAAYMPITGIFFIIFESSPAYLSDLFSGAGTGLGFFCFSILSIKLLSHHRPVHPWLVWYLRLTAGAGLVQAALSPFEAYVYVTEFVGLNAILFSLVLLFAFGSRVRSGSMADRFIFSALFLTVVGILINFSRLMGWLPENMFTIHAFQVSSLLHMLLLNQAFAERVMQAERDALKSAQMSEQRAKEMAADMNQELIKVLGQEKSLRLEQERFIDLISHEYRTPLSILKTNLEILELKEKADWTGRHNLHVMQQAAVRLQEVFDKTIKGTGWRQALAQNFEEKELVSLMDHFMDEAHLMWNHFRFNYSVNVRQAWYKSLDTSLMKTVVFNLVDNACKYSSDPLGIDVSLWEKEDGTGLIFSVRNPVTGRIGRSDSELTEKYIRGANSAGTSGLGLGLNLVQQIVEQQGDQVELIEHNNAFEVRVILFAEMAEMSLSDFESGDQPGL